MYKSGGIRVPTLKWMYVARKKVHRLPNVTNDSLLRRYSSRYSSCYAVLLLLRRYSYGYVVTPLATLFLLTSLIIDARSWKKNVLIDTRKYTKVGELGFQL